MDLFTELAASLHTGLAIWEHKEANKYRDQLLSIERRRYEEKSKPRPNMATLDGLEFELVLLRRAFSATAQGGSTAPTQA